MTADARRDEALRRVGEAIAVCEAASSEWVHPEALVPECFDYADAAHIAYHDPAAMLRLHRANKATLAEHHSMNTGDPNRKTCVVCSHRNFPPGQNGPMKWPCPTAERVMAAYEGEAT